MKMARFAGLMLFITWQAHLAWGATIAILPDPLTVTPNLNDTMVTLTIPEGTWTNFSAFADWSSSDADAKSFLARWELEPTGAPSGLVRHTSTFLPDGAYGDNRSTALSWGGVFQNPIVSDGTTQVVFKAQQDHPQYGYSTGPATWANTTLVLDDTPIHETPFAGELTEDSALMRTTRPIVFFVPPFESSYDPDDPDTWLSRDYIPKHDRPHDVIPFHVTTDGYYRIDVFNEIGFDGSFFDGQLSLHEGDFNPLDQTDFLMELDWRLDSDHNGVEAFLEQGVQYYAVFSSSWVNDQTDYAPYEGSIRGVSGEAVIGFIPEPGTATLLGVCLAGLMRWRTSRRQCRSTGTGSVQNDDR